MNNFDFPTFEPLEPLPMYGLIIEISELPNGAHRNQSGTFSTAPEGWIMVPPELEAEALSMLPFINLTIKDGKLTAVKQGVIPPPEPPPPPPEPQPTVEDIIKLLCIQYGVEYETKEEISNEQAIG